MGRGARLAGVALAAVAGIAVCALAASAGVIYWRVHPPRVAVGDNPGRHGLSFEDVSFVSGSDGTTLRGWYLPAPRQSGRAVVIAHGIDDDRLVSGITLRLAPDLLAAGFDVLAFDLRASGESGGDEITFGARESGDVLGAVAEARRHGASSVAVLGFSQGGAAAILAAARSRSIDAVATDSAFAALEPTLRRQAEGYYRLPPPLAGLVLSLFAPIAGFDPATIRPVDAIAAVAPRPVLIIQGQADATVDPADAERLQMAAGPSAALWMVPGADHIRAYVVDPAAYTQRLLEFLRMALPERGTPERVRRRPRTPRRQGQVVPEGRTARSEHDE